MRRSRYLRLLVICAVGLAAAMAGGRRSAAARPGGVGVAAQAEAETTDASKAELTPAFWQRDPAADFPDEGRMHCAPAAVSDGLIYLAAAKAMASLVPGDSHEAQIALIEELAEAFETDPKIGGTNPDQILSGLQSYVASKGYRLGRLELKSWRPVRAANRKFKLGTKPDMPWMRAAARSSETVVLFNFGWYQEAGESYTRKGGHWVAVVGAGSEREFAVRNPLLESERQLRDTRVELTLIDDDLEVTNDQGEAVMKGYYEGDGPGLPHGKTVKAILDAVIVFSVEARE